MLAYLLHVYIVAYSIDCGPEQHKGRANIDCLSWMCAHGMQSYCLYPEIYDFLSHTCTVAMYSNACMVCGVRCLCNVRVHMYFSMKVNCMSIGHNLHHPSCWQFLTFH